MGIVRLFALAALALLVAGIMPAAKARPLVHANEYGIELYAAQSPKGAKYDVPIVGDRPALRKLQRSVAALMTGSPMNARAIRKLQANGRIEIIYDPSFPKEKETEFEVAAYFPNYYDPDGNGGRDFMVVVGRHGIKWPVNELAAVLAHELAGHAMQRLRGQFESMRYFDRECEAQLYQERAIEDLHVDTSTPFMVQFRQNMEQRYCSYFKRFQARRLPATLKLWDARDPNVPRLLAAFRDYMASRKLVDRAAPAR